jgi:hypothetical protein
MDITWYGMMWVVGSRKVEKNQKPVYVAPFTEKYPLGQRLRTCAKAHGPSSTHGSSVNGLLRTGMEEGVLLLTGRANVTMSL